MNCEIIIVGTEILTGLTLNTNAQFLASELASLGIEVKNITTVGDVSKDLAKVFKNALKTSDIIILSGNLWPLEDHLTKEDLAKALDSKFFPDYDDIPRLENWYFGWNKVLAENNGKKSYYIKSSIKVNNQEGIGPGVYVHGDKKHIFLLPGKPEKLVSLFFSFVKPELKKLHPDVKPELKNLSTDSAITKNYMLTGLEESEIEEKLKNHIGKENPSIAINAGIREIKLSVTATGENAQALLDKYDRKIRALFKPYIFSYSNESLVQAVGKLLIKKHKTIAIAESCTGGMVSQELTSVPGISSSFPLGLVTYSNEAKQKLLHVKEETLDEYGAVSAPVCEEMAKNVRKILHTDFGISVTGVAGPDSQEGKPVGLVYIGFKDKVTEIISPLRINGNREEIRKECSQYVFQLLWQYLHG